MMKSFIRLSEYLRTHGIEYTIRRSGQKAAQRFFRTYARRKKSDSCTPEELNYQRNNSPDAGLISVVVPMFNTDPRMLWDLVDSLKAQTYENFEVILYDDHSDNEGTRAILRKIKEKRDPRFRVIWGKENRGISGNTNEAIALAQGEYVALCDHDDLVEPETLWRVADCIVREQPDMIYTDEDRITENGRGYMDPHIKADYCPDTLNTDNYICHMLIIRKSILEAVGGLRSGFDGSQDHDLILRVAEETKRISHIPYTLYSWREVRSSASHTDLQKCLESGCRAVMEHEARAGREVTAKPVDRKIRLWYTIPEEAEVEAVVHGDTEEVCSVCFQELQKQTGWKNLTARLVVSDDSCRIKAINQAAAESKAEYLLILDSEIREMNPDFIREMLMYAQREDVAGVTPVLVGRRDRITHGGFALGMEGTAQCVNERLYVRAGGWHDMMNKVHNVSAVSLGCMLVRRDNWLPLDEIYQSGLVMADLGMRQRENGKWFVYTPHAIARRMPCAMMLNRKERKGRPEIEADMARFTKKWGKDVHDPCYSGRFRKDKANYRF